MLALPENEVHLYWLESETAAVGEQWLGLLSAEERARHSRFLFEKDRRIFLLAHAMARLALARYTGGDPASLEFDVNPYGKPFLCARAGAPCPGFNLSHTHGMVALAIGREPDVGVDVEDTARAGDWARLAGNVFTEEERAGLGRLPPAERQRRFYELWTLKEAYIKARGMGLSIPLDGFSMRMPARGPIGIQFGASVADDAAGWQFEMFAIATFRLALAIRARDRRKWTVRLLAGG